MTPSCRKIYFLLLVLTATIGLHAQDTLRAKAFDAYWTKPRLVPRAGIAIQESASAEIGITHHKILVHPLGLSSFSKYVTSEVIVRDNHVVVGPKAGIELTAGLLGFAGDVTYYTDGHAGSIVATPKAGLSIYGFVNLFYGYNFSLSNDSFNYIAHNRFSITVNFNRDYGDLKDAPRR